MMWRYLLLFLPLVSSSTLSAQTPLNVPPALTGTEFDLTMTGSQTEFFPGILTATYGYNGSFGGPTLILRKGDTVRMNVINQMTEAATTHWHGMHVPPEDDGGPHAVIDAGATWSPEFLVMDDASTMWYHPHLHMMTTRQVTMGLAGMILVRDDAESAARLPRRYGEDEFPLILQDRSFDGEGQFVHGFLGDTMLVNGTYDPYLDVPAQLVRFRVLNGSGARGYMLGLGDNTPFYVVGADGGLLNRPVEVQRMRITPGERLDLLIDFSGLAGRTNFLVNYSEELDEGIPGSTAVFTDEVNRGLRNVLEFRTRRPRRGTMAEVPQRIQVPEAIRESEADLTRTVEMTLVGGFFGFDGQTFDMSRVDQTVMLGDTEIWELVNTTDFAHPFHIHDIQFYILDRNGIPPELHEAGKKDTVLVNAGETVRIITRFEDFADPDIPYMYHCHILPHEDFGMMAQFIVVDPDSRELIELITQDGTPRLEWSANLDEFSIQTSTDLIHWTTITEGLSEANGFSRYEAAETNGLRFFRMAFE